MSLAHVYAAIGAGQSLNDVYAAGEERRTDVHELAVRDGHERPTTLVRIEGPTEPPDENTDALDEIVLATGWTAAQAKEEALWALHAALTGAAFAGQPYTTCAERTPAPRRGAP